MNAKVYSILNRTHEVISGTGTSTQTTKYIPSGKLVWIESMGLEVEFSSTTDITWNANKYIRIQRKHYLRDGQAITYEATFVGQADALDNWRCITALTESMHFLVGNLPTAKHHARYDFIARGDNHYWFINQQGDEYIKLVADVGIFTYTSDKPILFMKGYIFDLNDIRGV